MWILCFCIASARHPPAPAHPPRTTPPPDTLRRRPLRWTSLCRTAQNVALFSPPATIFILSSSLEGRFVEFWWCMKRWDPQMCTFGLSGCRVKPRRLWECLYCFCCILCCFFCHFWLLLDAGFSCCVLFFLLFVLPAFTVHCSLWCCFCCCCFLLLLLLRVLSGRRPLKSQSVPTFDLPKCLNCLFCCLCCCVAAVWYCLCCCLYNLLLLVRLVVCAFFCCCCCFSVSACTVLLFLFCVLLLLLCTAFPVVCPAFAAAFWVANR